MISVRLITMRKKLETALGRLHASFYTSFFTIIVESGAFATLWGIVYLSTLVADHWSRDAFSQPYYYIIVSPSLRNKNALLCPQTLFFSFTGYHTDVDHP
jgi:hypothetical protein